MKKASGRASAPKAGPGDASKNKDHCGSCNNLVAETDRGIECEFCKFWFHSSCQGVPKRLYDVISEGNPNLHWYCRTCNDVADDMLGVLKSVKVKQEKIETDMHEMREEMRGNRQECVRNWENVTEKIGKIKESGNSNETIKLCIDEINERHKRKNNLIFYGIPESKDEEAQVRKNEDLEAINTTVKSISGDMDLQILAQYRLGMKNGKDRPLKVVFNKTETCIEILKNLREVKLKDNVRVSRDRTQTERKEYRELREELKQREEMGEKDLVIRNGRITKFRFRPKP